MRAVRLRSPAPRLGHCAHRTDPRRARRRVEVESTACRRAHGFVAQGGRALDGMSCSRRVGGRARVGSHVRGPQAAACRCIRPSARSGPRAATRARTPSAWLVAEWTASQRGQVVWSTGCRAVGAWGEARGAGAGASPSSRSSARLRSAGKSCGRRDVVQSARGARRVARAPGPRPLLARVHGLSPSGRLRRAGKSCARRDVVHSAPGGAAQRARPGAQRDPEHERPRPAAAPAPRGSDPERGVRRRRGRRRRCARRRGPRCRRVSTGR